MLRSYLKLPADYLMQYFDMVQLGDDFSWSSKQFQQDPALVAHAGNVSTRDSIEKMEQMMLNRRFEPQVRQTGLSSRTGSKGSNRIYIFWRETDSQI
jgi:hypothetical protein